MFAALCAWLWCLPAPAADTNHAHFYFVQISDTHLGDRDFFERTRKIVDTINHLPMPIEFTAVTGDFTMERTDDGVTFSNGVNVLKGLTMPFYLLPGNHDILPKKFKETSQVFTNFTGGFLTRAERQGVVFLFMYTEPLAEAFPVEGYEPLRQLEQCLKEAGDKPVVVFHHTPSVEDFYNNQMHPGWPQDVADQWGRLLNAYRVRAAIAGHFHRDEMHMLGNVPLYVAPAVATYWGRTTAFRIYEVADGRIVSYRTQYPEMGKQHVEGGSMPTYTVKLARRTPKLDGGWDSPGWKQARTAELTNFRKESSDHRPRVQVRMLYDKGGVYGLFRVEDRFVRSVQKKFNGPVCTDSCVEFFVKPKADKGYFNFEINAGGTLLVSYVVDPSRKPEGGFKDFTPLSPKDGAKVDIYHSLPAVVEPELQDPTTWFVGFHIPFALMEKYAGPLGQVSGQEWKANFYKCADKTSKPHWVSWSPVDELNFHLPRCFGTLVFEAKD